MNFAIIRTYQEPNRKVVVVNTKDAIYKNKPWGKLNRYERRKFDNLVFLSEPTAKLKVFYQTPTGLQYAY